MTKSYVTMEQQVCCVCGIEFDTGAILMDRRMRDKFESTTVTGYGACPEHQKLADEGYVALIALEEDSGHNNMHISDGVRSGKLAHIRKKIFDELFNITLDPKKFPMAFVDAEVIDQLEQLQKESL